MSQGIDRYAIVVDGIVTNVVLWDGQTEYVVEGDLVKITDDRRVNAGFIFDGKSFAEPDGDSGDE